MLAVELTPTERSRLERLVGMLGSAFDGERANAAAFIEKMARERKLTIPELLGLAGTNHSGNSDHDTFARQRAEREAAQARHEAEELRRRVREAERAATEARQAAPTMSQVSLPPDWRNRLGAALAQHTSQPFLDGWQQKFTTDAMGWNRPTVKMAAKIVEILEIFARQLPPLQADDSDDWEDI